MAAGTWTTTGAMSVARSRHTATLLPNGKVLVAGGGTASAELYDPMTGSWTATGTMSVARSGHTATLLPNGQVLAAGGDSAGRSTELYNPATGTWAATGTMTAEHSSHTATLLSNGQVLVVGGCTSTAELYNPALGTWSTTGDWGGPARIDHTATMLANGKVLVTGGFGYPTCLDNPSERATGAPRTGSALPIPPVYLSTAELYDSGSGSWTATGSLTEGRAYHTATLLPNGQVLVAGGFGPGLDSESPWYVGGYAELYDPALGTFRVLAAPREMRRDHTATRLPSGKVLIAAGYANAQSIASAEIYDPATDTWSAVADLATARRLFTATLLPDGTVLAAGGHYIPPASQGATYNLASAELYGLAVRRVLPATGPLAGGTSITITGTGFAAGATAALGGVELAGATIVDATTISAVTGPHGAGAVDVTVRNPDGQQATLVGGFTFSDAPISVGTNPSTLRFGATKAGAQGDLTAVTPVQNISVSFSGIGSAWTATTMDPWLQIAEGTGVGAGRFSVSIANPSNVIAGRSLLSGAVVVTSAAATNSPVSIPVTLTVDQTDGVSMAAPFGQVDTPVQHANGVQGAIGVTGWALHDVEVEFVDIYRDCMPANETGLCQWIGTTAGGHYPVVYIGRAAFLEGARPDVEAAYPTYPLAQRAGWGFLLLTNMLPDLVKQQPYGGQGTVNIYAFAHGSRGTTLLGRTAADHTPTTIACTNDTIAKPFGAIDTPGQGVIVSGLLPNFGWALTPDTDTVAGNDPRADGTDILIPPDGSTMFVFLDGVATAAINYNHCRGTVGTPPAAGVFCNDDIGMVFGYPAPQTPPPPFITRTANPTRYRNLDAGRGAIGVYTIDTTTLANGLHTIAWSVTDSAGRTEGIGSRFFQVLNTGTRDPTPPDALPHGFVEASRGPGTSAVTTATISPPAPDVGARLVPGAERAGEQPVSGVLRDASRTGPRSPVPGPADAAGVQARVGFDLRAPFVPLTPDADGVYHVRLGDVDRLELDLGPDVETGYLDVNGDPRELPIGATLDPATGAFTWAPPAGYLGTYRLVLGRARVPNAPSSGGLSPSIRLRTSEPTRPYDAGDGEWGRGTSRTDPRSPVPGPIASHALFIDVTIAPRTAPAPGESAIRMHLDAPADGATLSGPFTVAGWAFDPQAGLGSGIGAVHVWAQRTDVPGVPPVFLGAATLGGKRPDVAAAFGAQFDTAGFGLTHGAGPGASTTGRLRPPEEGPASGSLPPGTYEITAYVWNIRTARWEDARTASVAVR